MSAFTSKRNEVIAYTSRPNICIRYNSYIYAARAVSTINLQDARELTELHAGPNFRTQPTGIVNRPDPRTMHDRQKKSQSIYVRSV